MAKNSVRDFDATAANNTDIQSVNIAEGCAPSGINNAIRELMADMKDVSAGTIALESPQADSLTVTGDLTVDTSTLKVDSTNNRVGILEASPTVPFEVKGAQAFASSASNLSTSTTKAAAKIRGSSDASTALFFGSSTGDAEQYIQSANGAGSAADDILLNPFGGNVGIGVTTANTYSGFTTVTIGGSGKVDLDFENNGTVMASIFTETSDFGIQSANDMVFQTGGSNDRMRINSSGAVSITGSISKGSGSFKIDHPLDSKSDTHHLVHSFVEAPQADNIYRGTVDLVDGSATVNIDTVAGMTDGTFVALNREVQCFTSNETGWTAIKGSVSGNTLTITAQENTCADTISWLVVGERKDAHMYDTEWTDDNGKVIVEPLKPDDTDDAPRISDDGDD